MTSSRLAERCRWATPTVFLAMPFWLAAEQYPWSCQVDAVPRPLEDTDACRVCARRVPSDAGQRCCADGRAVSAEIG